jgi:uncharacterized protein involved in response to NO
MKTLPIRPLPSAPRGIAPSEAPDPRWRLARLLSAPHRLGFFAAALLLATSALWWAVALAARAAGITLAWAVPPPVAHGLLMSLGFMPLFIVGFLFTAGPRWLAMPDVPAPVLRRPVAAMVGGWALALPGFHISAALAAAGVALVAFGWAALVLRFVRLVRASPAPDTLHATLVAVSGTVGVLALLLATIGLGLDQSTLTRVATRLALWGFLAPVFAVVSHRMIPFFTASALPMLDSWRPNWLLWVMVGVLWLQGGFAVAELLTWPLPAAARWAQAAFEAPAAVLLLWIAWRWGLVQSLKIRLLAMLHAGFLWLGISLALSAASHGWMAATGDAQSLGLAPLHALTMGYLGATMIAMITRVAAGHSGRPVAADNLAWGLYWALQTAALLRVAAALWPATHTLLTLCAVAAWAFAALGWAWRYGGWLGRPRTDGRPG